MNSNDRSGMLASIARQIKANGYCEIDARLVSELFPEPDRLTEGLLFGALALNRQPLPAPALAADHQLQAWLDENLFTAERDHANRKLLVRNRYPETTP